MYDAISSSRVEINKVTVRQMLQRLSAGDIAGFSNHLSINYVRHCQAMPPQLQEIHGKEAMHRWLLANRESFPDYHEELEWIIGEGDFVSWRSRATGTQLGPIGPFPATGKRMDLVIIGMHRFERDLVAETWTSWDNLAAFTQLGHFPPS